MPTVIKQPQTTCFSSMLSDIVFGTTEDSGAVTLAVVCRGVSQTLISETLYPDSDGHITLIDCPQLTLTCTLDDGTSVSITPVHVLYCACEIGSATDAASFIGGHFLTLMDGKRYTAMGHGELLSAYGGAYQQGVDAPSATFKVMADILGNDGNVTVQTLNLSVEPCNTADVQDGQLLLYEFDASPRRLCGLFNVSEDSLQGYTVWMGARSQDFTVAGSREIQSPSLIFQNSFGVSEILNCAGKHSKDSKYERKSARQSGRLRHYSIVEDRVFSAVTGWMNDAMALWADDLFRSYDVHLWSEDDGIGREVVVSDSKSVLTNIDGDMTMYEFSYGYSQRNHNVMRLPHMCGRLHVEQFNETFN